MTTVIFKPVQEAYQTFTPQVGGWSSYDRFPRELADINGDGLADIVGFGEDAVYTSLAQRVLDANARTSSLEDFNSDGKSDLLVFQPDRKWSGVLFMDGENVVGSVPLWTGWKPVGKGDFDLDGKSDVVVQNLDDGRHVISYGDGSAIQRSEVIQGWAGWDILGTGTFSENQTPDLLIRHPSQGWYGVLTMGGQNGNTVTGSRSLTMWSGWDVKALGDFNGDNRSDLVIQHQSEDWFGIAFLNEQGQIESSQSLLGWAGWDIIGSSDVDNDGHSDILIRHRAQGWTGAWLMQGNQITDSVSLQPWAGWEITG